MLTGRFASGLVIAGLITIPVCRAATDALAGQSWTIRSAADWKDQTASADRIVSQDGSMVLDRAGEGQWTGKWHEWQGIFDSAEMSVEAEIDLFDNKTIEVVVKGSEKPYTDSHGVQHDWYGRCMMAIIDENRWIMSIRSGTGHINWGGQDTIHLLTSANEGRTWNGLNQWFDGSPIEGMSFEDGATHSELGLYRMPNGDLILQFWRTDYSSGTKQLRSTDNGKTWAVDIDRIHIDGITRVINGFGLGTKDWFVDPENPSHIYMAFQYYHYLPEENGKTAKASSLLAKSLDNGKSYNFLNWMSPLGVEEEKNSGATVEPAIEYVGNRTIVAVMRDGVHNRWTWQAISTDMGAFFSKTVHIGDKIRGEVPNGL